MSTSNQRKRKRREKNYNPIDASCERENAAIKKVSVIGNVQQPRLNRTYSVDGYTFCTGKKYRWGGGTSVTDKRIQPSFLWDK
jgi:hypothetical protein